MITALNLEAYRDLSDDAQRDVEAFVEGMGAHTERTFKIVLDFDRYAFGVTLSQHRTRDGQAFIGYDGIEIAWEENDYLRLPDGQYAHVERVVMN